MAKNTQTDKVVGVFMDDEYAQRAMQALQSAGFRATQADESAIKAFRNSGFQDEVVDLYRSRYNEGNTILVVEGTGQGENALGTMLDYGAEYINLSSKGGSSGSSGQMSKSQGTQYDAAELSRLERSRRQYGRYDESRGRANTEDEIRIQLRKENLTATKTANQAGEVQVHTEVVERQEQIPVTLSHEEVYIERRAVDGQPDAGEITGTESQTIRVPVYEEQVQLQKQSRVVEEVEVGKRAVQEQQTLSGTVREERLVVDNQGDIEVRGDNTQSGRNTMDRDNDTQRGGNR